MTRTFHLTNNGNVLCKNSQKIFFAKPNGELIRECTLSQYEHLSGICPEIEFLEIPFNGALDVVMLPKWKLVATSQTYSDLSNYDYRTCNNGGNYSFGVMSYFFAAVVNGKFTIRELEIQTTSAEFSYDELAGSFQQNLQGIFCINAPECPWIATQTRSGENENFALEEYAKEISVESFLAAQCTEISQRDDEDQETRYTPIWTAEQVENFKAEFSQMGWSGQKRNANDRRGGGERI